jgi:hypothetical protein
LIPFRCRSLAEVQLRRVVFKRELNLVKTLAMTTGAYVVLVSPMCIVNFTDYCVQHPNLLLMSYTLYVTIYFINFLIYVTLHKHHRKMCVKTLEELWGFLARFPKMTCFRGDPVGSPAGGGVN